MFSQSKLPLSSVLIDILEMKELVNPLKGFCDFRFLWRCLFVFKVLLDTFDNSRVLLHLYRYLYLQLLTGE